MTAQLDQHKTADEAVALVQALKPLVMDACADRDVVVCPPFTSLQAVAAALKDSPIGLGAQNMYWEEIEL